MQEKKSHITIKNGLFAILVGLLLLPMLQQRFKFYESTELGGYETTLENPYFIKEQWFNGEYQKKQEEYISKNFGFRPEVYRLFNQYHYSVYNEAKANGVIIGKENYLYELNYIKAYLGRDFIGADKIKNQVFKLDKISDTLSKLNTKIVVLLAPGKGSYYPEYIPDRFTPNYKTVTNYAVYAEYLAKSNIEVLDAQQWFKEMRNTTKYPLFPKTGIHWSNYGAMVMADSLVYFLENLTQKKLPHLKTTAIESSTTMRDADDDIEKGMNLIFDIEDLTMGYPKYFFVKKENSESLNVVTIGDSYYWGLYFFGINNTVFNNGSFWYYFKEIYPDSHTKTITVDEIDMKQELEKQDIILILSTDANLNRFGFGFIDRVYDLYYK